MGYTKDIIRGVSWMSSFRVISRGISFFRTVLLARILTPTDFGLVGIASIVLSFMEVFTETGINIFLIQRKDDIDKYVNTAWIVSILRGFLISIIILLVAYPVSVFFNSPQSFPLLLLMSVVPLLRGLINPSVVKFYKELNFHTEFIYRISIFTVESVVTIMLALYLKSASAIIWGLIFGAMFEVCLSHAIIKPKPSLLFRRDLFHDIISKGKWITASGIVGYLFQNIDDVFVGRMFGTKALGLYDTSYRISMLPISEVSDVITSVTFPVFVKISGDLVRLQRAFIKSVTTVSVIVVPIGLIGFYFSHQIIDIILGPQWIEAVPIFQILSILGVVRAILNTVRAPLYALERQDMMTTISVFSVVGLAITVFPFSNIWGIIGVAYAALFGMLLSVVPTMYFLKKVFTESRK